ncbi:DUF2628 domain-containing protein [Bacillus mangrovi]|uniref:DUF2628 domain-containing protein n=1 Tax=Metabacillus mangrovi TaxID=1491830 RepID=A0A7X2V448_9BACI|nr:zinc-ribbon domain-containing protein [Metabacillus mangrovi]MTH53025.1 DUF2628 domain-containing protein [Metabacillus mangrovi]
MFCTKCGMRLGTSDKFCAKCGSRVDRETVPAGQSSVQTAAALEAEKSAKIKPFPDGGISPAEKDSSGSAVPADEKRVHNAPDRSTNRQGQAPVQLVKGDAPGKKTSPELAYADLFTGISGDASETKEGKTGETGPAAHIQHDDVTHRESAVQTKQEANHVIGSNAMAEPQQMEEKRTVPVPAELKQSTKASQKTAPAPGSFNPQEMELLAVFAGENSKYYVNNWSKPYSMNWAAFLLTIFWMGYRKLMAPMFITAGTFILAGLIIAATGLYWLVIPAVPLFMAASGFIGNRLYFHQAKEKIDKIQAVHGTWEEKRRLLAAAGGTSPGGVFIVFGVMFGYLFISAILFSVL